MQKSRTRQSTVVAITALYLLVGLAWNTGTSAADPPVVLITGANRGIGLELARQFKAGGYSVIGTARNPEEAIELQSLGVRIETLDVADADSVRQLAFRLRDKPVDLLINNAAIYPQQHKIGQLDFDAAVRTYEVNSLGPMRVIQALLPHLQRGANKTIVNISSNMGSMTENIGGGSYAYRASKAALNSFTRTLSLELQGEDFICVAIHPGWVRTRMGGPKAPLSPEESGNALIAIIRQLSPADNGRFMGPDGNDMPW